MLQHALLIEQALKVLYIFELEWKMQKSDQQRDEEICERYFALVVQPACVATFQHLLPVKENGCDAGVVPD